MKTCIIGLLVLFDSDVKDFSIYNREKAELFKQLRPLSQHNHIYKHAIEAKRQTDCWILNLLGDNK